MTNEQLPRPITADEVQVGDRIRIEWGNKGISQTETLTVALLESGRLYAPEGGWTYIRANETVTLLDRPEPEPEWVADGICVDENGGTWLPHEGEWYHPGGDCYYSAKELQIAHGPISRHPAVIAAEKRGEQRVLDVVGPPRVINGDAS